MTFVTFIGTYSKWGYAFCTGLALCDTSPVVRLISGETLMYAVSHE